MADAKVNPVPTFENLLFKPRRVKRITVTLAGQEEGSLATYDIKLKAIGSDEYDELVSKHKPTAKQKAEGRAYNPDTFIPALLSASLEEPSLTPEQVKQIFESGAWSTGELNTLVGEAINLNLEGLDIPFTESASA
jgi:hypothetical protein